MRTVIVGGVVALDEGQATGKRGGESLARSEHMPTRPLTVEQAHGVRVKSSLVDDVFGLAKIEVDLKSAPGGNATGFVRLYGPGISLSFPTGNLGIMQTAEGWASVSGWASTSSRGNFLGKNGAQSAVTVILDQANPLGPPDLASIALYLGKQTYTFSIPKSAISIH